MSKIESRLEAIKDRIHEEQQDQREMVKNIKRICDLCLEHNIPSIDEDIEVRLTELKESKQLVRSLYEQQRLLESLLLEEVSH